MDILSDILSALRLRATVYFDAEFRAPWSMDIRGGEFANFHIMRAGHCWVSWDGVADPIFFGAGDLVVFPHGHRHVLTHAPRAQARPADELLAQLAPRPGAWRRAHRRA